MSLEVPGYDEVRELPIEWATSAQPWIVSVTALAGDSATVTVTWDAVASSVKVQWFKAGRSCITLERETATRVYIDSKDGVVEFRILSESEGLFGELVVSVGNEVSVTDALLRH